MFDYMMAGNGFVDDKPAVIVSLCIKDDSKVWGITNADDARKFADMILRAANEIDPLEIENEK